MTPHGHFCSHGNLRYSCATCRAERRASRALPEPKRYGQPLGKGGNIPDQPWRMKTALLPHQTAAVERVAAAGNGVVVLPAPLGLRQVAFALLRRARHDVDAVIFLVPNVRAVQAWSDALHATLNVPDNDIEDQGRNVRDWHRLRPVLLWTPEIALRHASGLRQHAKRLALFVDSPESTAYEKVLRIFRAPFASRTGVSAARLQPPPREAWQRLDALGGVVYRYGVREAIQAGQMRRVRYEAAVVDPADEWHKQLNVAFGQGKPRRAIVWVDDAAAGRAVEEALSRQGIEPRFVGAAASEELARRATNAVASGTAQVLVRTPDAPVTALEAAELVVFTGHLLSQGAATAHVLSQIVGEGTALRVVDLVPQHAPEDEEDAQRIAGRVQAFAQGLEGVAPPLPWLAAAGGLPSLPLAVADQVSTLSKMGWQRVQGLMPELLSEGWEASAAQAALADAYIAAACGVPSLSLGAAPLPSEDDGASDVLSGPFPLADSLPALAMIFPEAEAAFGSFLRGELAPVMASYADAPILHHLVPDLRRLLLATADLLSTSRAPQLDGNLPRDAAETLLLRGGTVPATKSSGGAPEGQTLRAEAHMEQLLAGIDAERAHDIELSVEEIQQLSGVERQRRGRTLMGLVLEAKRRTDMGLELRYALPVVPGRSATPLPYTDLTPGALVDLSIGDGYDPVLRGTVASIGAHSIKVVAVEDRERRAPGTGTRIDQVGNPRVYDLLARAVRSVYGAGDHTMLAGPGGLRSHLICKASCEVEELDAVQLFSPGLNPSQRNIVGLALASKRLALVHGPPGTGKTTTLVEYIRQEVARGHRVLVTADSNAAVDAVLDAYQSAGGLGVRTGPLPSLTRPHLVGHHVDTLSARAPAIDWLRRIPVVFTTHVSSGSLPGDLGFDVVVQDEASQATEAASCLSLQRAPKLVLAGDHLQLPPVVRSSEAVQLGMSTSLFERMHAAYGQRVGRLLNVQYRMHADIEAWSNAAFYEGRIETGVDPEPVANVVAAGILPESPRAFFVDVAGAESAQRTSKERMAEAKWVDAQVRRMLDAGVRPSQIAVIAAYRAQVRLLRQMLDGTDVDVGTIDAFQGSERDIVIVSLVRGNPRGEVGFVRDPRRLNVAMTRARRHLIVVGSRATLAGTPILDSLLAHLTPLDAA